MEQAHRPLSRLCSSSAVLTEGDSLVKYLFAKVGANPAAVATQIDREIEKLPK